MVPLTIISLIYQTEDRRRVTEVATILVLNIYDATFCLLLVPFQIYLLILF